MVLTSVFSFAGIELVNLLNDKEKKHTGKIADYLPGRSSALIKEKQKVRSFNLFRIWLEFD